MANTSSTHVINVTDNGTLKAATQDAQQLNSSLEAAARTANKVSAARPPGPSFVAAKAAARARQDGEDSGTARGIGGLTGAAGRDFAKQSEGLGGLVRLYATFAANIFAATAAFGALSKAADTTNMVKGLDQLGASSGKNLGSLAKKVVDTTDYAISLREAMESVAKASAAGLDSKQILAMSEAAKKASQALGVDMGDAISRLTRGISKLEPELLDELGLFTKVDKSTQDYARSVGKATSSLTDFERRQAFANAVLAEAKQKFSVIDIPANPYSQLLASFKDISQVALELVNKVLGPLVKLLAESPTALAGVMAGIAALLLRTAIPAIGSWREGLKEAAADAAKTAKAFTESFDDKFNDRLNASFRIPGLEKNLEKAIKAADIAKTKLAAISIPDSLSKIPSVGKFINEPESAKNNTRITTLIKEREKKLAEDVAGTKTLTAVKRQQAEEEIRDLNRILVAKKLVNTEEDKRIAAARALTVAQEGAQGRADKPLGRFDPQTIAINKARSLENAATKSRLVSMAAEDAAILGVRDSMRSLNAEIAKEGLTGWNKYSTVARGALAATSTRIFGLIGALGSVGIAIGIAVAAFETFSALFSDNAKQVKEFDSAVMSANSSAELMGKTLANNAKQLDFGISARGISALASAFKEVTNSVEELTSKLKLADDSAGWFDRMVDDVKQLFGKGLQQTYAKTVSASIVAGLDGIKSPEAKKKAEDNIKALLKITNTSRDSINKALAGIDNSKVISIGTQLGDILGEAGKVVDEASLSITNYSENMSKAGKAYDELSASLNDNTAFGKLGTGFVETGFAIAKTTGDIRSNIAALIDVAEDASKLRFLPAEAQQQLLDFLPKLKNARALIGANTAALANLQEIIDAPVSKSALGNNDRARLEGAYAAKIIVTEQLKATEKIRDEMVAMTNTISNAMVAAGEKMLDKAVTAAKEVARINALRTITSGMSGVGTASLQASIQREEIDTQLKVISAMEELTIATLKTGLIMQAENLKSDLKSSDEGVRDKAEKLSPTVNLVKELVSTLNSKQLQDYYSTLKETDGVLKAMLFPFVKAFKESTTQRTKLAGQKEVTSIQERQGIRKEQVDLARELEQSTFNQKTSQAEINKLTTYQNGALAQSTLLSQQQAALELSSLSNLREEEVLIARISEARVRIKDLKANNANPLELKAARDNYDVLEQSLNSLFKEQALRTAIFQIQNKQAVISNKFAKDREILEYLQQQEDIRIKVADLILQGQQSELEYLGKIGAISEENLITSTKELAIKRLIAEQDAQILQINRDRTVKLAVVAEAGQKADLGSNESDKQDNRAREAADIERINNLANQGIELAKQQSAQKEKYLTLLAEEDSRQTELTKNMNRLVSATESLATVFSGVGTAIGNSLQALMTFGQTQEKYDVAKKARMEKLAEYEESDPKRNELLAEEAKANKKNASDQLSNIGNIAKASKNMFNERSRGYKILAGIEKALHVVKLAMWAKEIVVETTKNTASIAGTIAKATIDGTAAVINAMKNLPTPLNFAAGAAMAAAIAALLSKIGGKSPSPPAGFSAEEQQTVQGTSQTFQDGKLVNRGGGALGDPTAKANVLNNTIERLEEYSFKNLEYSNKMLDSLRGIRKNTEGLSAILLQAGFNIKKSDEELGLGTTINRPLAASFTLDGLVEAIFGKSSGIAKLANKITNSIFGGKTTKELQDAGIQISGAIEVLARGGRDIGNIYQNVTTTRKGGWFRSDKTWTDVVVTPLESKATEAIGNVFAGIIDTVKGAADILGKDPRAVQTMVEGFNVVFKTSFKDLKPEELTAALNAEFGVAFNQLAERVIPELQRFRKPAEEYGDTIVRLARNIQVADLAFESMGKNISKVTADMPVGFVGPVRGISSIEQKVEAYERLLELSGGLEKFTTQAEFFTETFLTDAQRLAPIQAKLTERMEELGLSTINTREKFANVIKAIDVTSEGGARLYADLMNVAEAFAEVYPETRKLISAEEKRTSMLQQQIEIYKLEGKELEALYATRAEELAQMDDSLKIGQMYIYALQDEATLKGKLKTAYDKVANSITTITSSIKTLQTYSDSLKLGAQSNLTPAEKYKEAKEQAIRVAGLASGVLAASATAAEVQAKNDAINQLPSVSAAFLDASRVLYASSDQYNKDFSYIQNLIDATTISLTDQKTDAQNQLDRLDTQVSSLASINDNTASMAGLLETLNSQFNVYNLARSNTAIAGAAAGQSGYIVNTIDMSALTDMFSRLFTPLVPLIPTNATIMPVTDRMTTQAANDSTVRAIATLTQEVVALRADAQAQTQAVVAVTVETSNQITEAVEESSPGERGDRWEMRNVVNLR